MTKRRIRVVVAATAATLAAGGTAAGIALASGDEDETPITGPALAKASAAALTQTGGGRVSGTEVGDEDGLYEVEVTRADGSQVDVHLDREFAVVDERDDDETAEVETEESAEEDVAEDATEGADEPDEPADED